MTEEKEDLVFSLDRLNEFVDNELQIKLNQLLTEHNTTVINSIVTLLWFTASQIQNHDANEFVRLFSKMNEMVANILASMKPNTKAEVRH